MTLDDICNDVLRLGQGASRFMIGLAGPPGAGKSTLADALRQALLDKGETAEILPMDGFHMDNGLLKARGLLSRKGAPQTFDVRGLVSLIQAVKTGEENVLVPVFDRTRDIAIASAREISTQTRFILVEGNYLLLDEAPWDALKNAFDLTIFVGPNLDILEARLLERWQSLGLENSIIEQKLYGNDLPNGKYVTEKSRVADIVIDMIDLG